MPPPNPDQTPKQPWQDRIPDTIKETAARVEDELRNLTAYLNDEVVPDVRRFSSDTLRNAAIELHKLAQRMDDERSSATPPPPPPASSTPKP